jgi:2-iminobutanoate/2-iminopropanoate deaminase
MKNFVAINVILMTCLAGQGQTQFIKPDGIAPGTGYTHVVIASPGKLIFISGQVARNKEGSLVGKGDLKAQAGQVFENLNAALRAAGATFNDVVKINWYIKDYKPESLAGLRAVRDRYVNKDNPPASTLIGVSALAQEDYLIEVDAVASIPSKAGKTK